MAPLFLQAAVGQQDGAEVAVRAGVQCTSLAYPSRQQRRQPLVQVGMGEHHGVACAGAR